MGISLVTHTVGVLVASEVSIPALALRTPGPGTTLNTPGRPVDWAYPSAMYAQACSWRAPITSMPGSLRRDSNSS